jgi:hypothetical protein
MWLDRESSEISLSAMMNAPADLAEPSDQGFASRRYVPKQLMTLTERQFRNRLLSVLPHFEVLPQVAMGALIDPAPGLVGEKRQRARWCYQTKMVDFVVYDPKEDRIICLVEWDDASHDSDEQTRKDVERDALALEAGYVTYRFDAREAVGDDELRARVLRAAHYPKLALMEARKPLEERRSLIRGPAAPTRSSAAGRPRKPSAEPTLLAALAVMFLFAMSYVAWLMFQDTMAPRSAMREGSPRSSVWKSVAPRAPVVRNSSALSADSLTLHIPTCVVYEDKERALQAQRNGCSMRETVTFANGVSRRNVEAWAGTNDARLLQRPDCPPYRGWVREILSAPGQSDQVLFNSLQDLYSDALMNGCLAAPAVQATSERRRL